MNNPMTKLLKALLATTCVVSLAATGCVKQDSAPSDEIGRAIPTSDQVAIKLPGQSRMVGDVAPYYVVTRGVTATFNGGSAWVLILIHSIVQFPVTSVSGNTYTWGPWSGALDPAEYKLDVTANADGTYDYTLSGRSKTVANSSFEAVIDGHADPTPGELKGNGEFLIDFDASKRVNPIDTGDAKGQVDAHYDLAARHLDLHIMSTNANNEPVTADYAYNAGTDGSGDMTFSAQADIGGTPLAENLVIRSRWLSTGDGRSDARIDGGDLGATEANASECWNSLFREVYYTDSVNFAPTEGDAGACAYATSDLPPNP
jgi:hypothetical protein